MTQLCLLSSFLIYSWECLGRTLLGRTDKGAGPSGREVISLQKADSLVALETKWSAKKSLLYGTKGIRDKNFKSLIPAR
jgi:hypothetical protein